MQPIRVLMIGPYPRSPEQVNGGVAAAMMYLTEQLAASGDVEVLGVRIARGGSDRCETARYAWHVEDLDLGRFSLTTLYRRQLAAFSERVRHLRPDVVHAQGADVAGFLAVRSQAPSVVTVHGLLAECARLQTAPAARMRARLAAAVTERGTVRRAKHLIAISPFVTAHYGADVRGQVHDIPNPVPGAFFEVDRKPEAGRLLYAGRIANGKGLMELFEAFARSRNPGGSLVLAGATPDPAYERDLRGHAARLGIADAVRFCGLLDESALLDEFARAEVLVLPSYQETAPMVIQQAMAAGLPVIATRVGGVPHQVRDGESGLLVAPGDVVGLADRLQRIAREPLLRADLAAAASRHARKAYRAVAVAAATLGVYRGMLGRGAGHTGG